MGTRVGQRGQRAGGNRVGEPGAAADTQVLEHLELEHLVEPAPGWHAAAIEAGLPERPLQRDRLEEGDVDLRDDVGPAAASGLREGRRCPWSAAAARRVVAAGGLPRSSASGSSVCSSTSIAVTTSKLPGRLVVQGGHDRNPELRAPGRRSPPPRNRRRRLGVVTHVANQAPVAGAEVQPALPG